MTAYTKLDPQPAPRDDDQLVRYTRDVAQTQSLPWPCPWDEVGPGLYPDEVAYQLDTGELVAVSVEVDWQGDVTGFHAYARWIGADGSTTRLVGGRDAEVSWSFSMSTAAVLAYSVEEIMRDCYRMLLGGASTLTLPVADATGATVGETPLIELDPAANANRSIRIALSVVRSLGGHLTVDI